MDTGIRGERKITYYTLGSKHGRRAQPGRGGREIQRWYFNADYGLSREPPPTQAGEDFYVVNFQASTGPLNAGGNSAR